MDFSSIPLFNIMKTKMDFLSQRQGLLAQNIANADTPGYKAQDIMPPDFQKLVKGDGAPSHNLRLSAPHSGQLQAANTSNSDFKIINRVSTSELNPNGNNVTIEDESAQMAINQLDYQKMLNIYAKTISLFKTAIGNSNTGS